MKFEIPKIVKVISLAEYAPELAGARVVVWVNPPRELLLQVEKVTEAPEPDAEMRKILCELWNQGPDDTRWTPEEIVALEEHARETDPGLLRWMINHTFQEIFQHRMQIKKN